ncbi:hypothetical protein VTK26DRAFT_2195 [Humicola hyalothermophila]
MDPRSAGPRITRTSRAQICAASRVARAGTSTTTATAGDQLGFVAVSSITYFGPVSIYMARVPDNSDINTWEPAGNMRFKVAKISAVPSPNGGPLTSGEATWPAYNRQLVEFTLPRTLPSGKYLVCVESIALHQAQSPGGTQIYLS